MTYPVGHIIADEAVERAIVRQIADVQVRLGANTLGDYLGQVLLNADPARREAFGAWIGGAGDPQEKWPPKVSFFFRRQPIEMPGIVVRLAAESDGQFIGESSGGIVLGAGDNPQDLHADSWRVAVEVVVESFNADRCRYLYQLLKFWMGQERVRLADRTYGGFIEMSMMGGDLEHVKELEQAGRLVYRRGIKVTTLVHQTDALNVREQLTDVDAGVEEVGSGIVPRFYDAPL